MLSTTKCSGTAGIASAIVTNPFWVLKTKQAQNRTSILQAAKDLIKN